MTTTWTFARALRSRPGDRRLGRGRLAHLRWSGGPPALLVTRVDDELRIRAHREMVLALEHDPRRSVLPLALDHRQINHVLDSADDFQGETAAVTRFVRRTSRRARERR